MKNLNPEGFALVNADDPLCLDAADAASAQVVTYALNYPNAMIVAEDYRPRPLGCSFRITIKNDLSCLGGWIYPPQSFAVSLPLPGKAAVYNGLAAAAGALILGQQIDDIARGFKTFPGVKRRFELIRHNSITVIDDTAPNPPALKALFESLSALSFKKAFIVLCLEKDKTDKDRKMALELLEQEKSIPIGEIFLTASRSDTLSGQAGAKEERAFRETWRAGGGIARLSFFQCLEDALEEAVLSLREGDLLLLLGGTGMNRAAALVSRMFETPGETYDDKIVIPDEISTPGRVINPT
ncbi:MAG TPA: hypothetical protein GX697_03735 [Firmicutes bacterium]|nr:hypothetical protein [Bacillota bacterium]